MAYRVVTGFEDTETGVFYDIHTQIEDDNENNVMVIEDVKGKKTDLYIAKRKLVKYLYGDRYKLIES